MASRNTPDPSHAMLNDCLSNFVSGHKRMFEEKQEDHNSQSVHFAVGPQYPEALWRFNYDRLTDVLEGKAEMTTVDLIEGFDGRTALHKLFGGAVLSHAHSLETRVAGSHPSSSHMGFEGLQEMVSDHDTGTVYLVNPSKEKAANRGKKKVRFADENTDMNQHNSTDIFFV